MFAVFGDSKPRLLPFDKSCYVPRELFSVLIYSIPPSFLRWFSGVCTT